LSNWYSQDSEKELGENDIHVWVSYLNLHQAKLKHLYPLLSNEEKERSERFKFYKHRKNFIASHGFLHAVLSYYIDTPAEDIQFSHGEKGKPFIPEEQNPQNIQFNLSHSNSMAVLAVCKNQQLGIDIEFKEKKADWQGIIKRFYTQNEQDAIFKLTEETQKDAFFQVWTRKEAHMKVTGKGMSLAPTQFEVSVPPKPAEFIENLKSPDDNFYKMQDIILPEMYADYYACLSADFDFESITQFVYA